MVALTFPRGNITTVAGVPKNPLATFVGWFPKKNKTYYCILAASDSSVKESNVLQSDCSHASASSRYGGTHSNASGTMITCYRSFVKH